MFLICKKLESPLPKNALRHVWFWGSGEEEKFRKYILAISLITPLWTGRGPSFKQFWIPLTKEYFVQRLFEIGSVVLKKIFKFRKLMYFCFLYYYNIIIY